MSRLALVLAGGASRGAYEAGVLRFVYGELAQRLGRPPWPDVVSGTSVGALNGAFVVARDPDGLAWIANRWRTIEIPQVFDVTYGDLVRSMRAALSDRAFAVADPTPLRALVEDHFPTARARAMIAEHGLTWVVGATDLGTGRHVLFVDRTTPPDWPARPGVRVVHTQIGPQHALASGALPLLFPPVEIDGVLHVDGGLRQNTPLWPVLRDGADRVLVISLKRATQDLARPPQPANLAFLVGKLLNALLLDPVEMDMLEAEHVNRLIDWGTHRFGQAFATGLEADLGLRRAEILFLTPSEDLGAMAAHIFRTCPPNVHGAALQLLERAAGRTGPDADLLSYIYFDKAFTGAIEALGYEDAKRQEEAIVRLVAPGG
ncbi:MAG: patatin-like phospholipase family protein [Myxococcota bacterium]